jgi:hypothetical protein
MVHYENLSPDSIESFGKMFLDLLTTLLCKYLFTKKNSLLNEMIRIIK